MVYLFGVTCSKCKKSYIGKFLAIREMEQQCELCKDLQVFSDMEPMDPEVNEEEWELQCEEYEGFEDEHLEDSREWI